MVTFINIELIQHTDIASLTSFNIQKKTYIASGPSIKSKVGITLIRNSLQMSSNVFLPDQFQNFNIYSRKYPNVIANLAFFGSRLASFTSPYDYDHEQRKPALI